MIDISISLDPVAWAIELSLIVYLVKWFRFEKKESKKRPRKPKQTHPDIKVEAPTVVQVGEEKEPENLDEAPRQ